MDKETVVHMYSGRLLGHKKEHIFVSVLMRWMNLEPIIQTDVMSEKQISYINTHIYGIYKVGTEKPICRVGMEMQT